jgi:hypothetical protein
MNIVLARGQGRFEVVFGHRMPLGKEFYSIIQRFKIDVLPDRTHTHVISLEGEQEELLDCLRAIGIASQEIEEIKRSI